MLDKVQEIIRVNNETAEKIAALRQENEQRGKLLEKRMARVAIENVMGRFSILYSGGRYRELMQFFADTEQISFQRSDVGVYEGQGAVAGYFANLADHALPGSFRMMNLTSPVIEMAADGKTAQGMWFINGLEAVKDPGDPQAPAADLWINDKLAVEFLRTDCGDWRILRMTVCEEMRGRYHKSWGEYSVAPDYPAFDVFPAPTRPSDCHLPFRADRKSQKNLTTPEPHETYSTLCEHF